VSAQVNCGGADITDDPGSGADAGTPASMNPGTNGYVKTNPMCGMGTGSA
jgi:hypothetical protein